MGHQHESRTAASHVQLTATANNKVGEGTGGGRSLKNTRNENENKDEARSLTHTFSRYSVKQEKHC